MITKVFFSVCFYIMLPEKKYEYCTETAQRRCATGSVVFSLDVESTSWDIQVPNSLRNFRRKKHTDFLSTSKTLFFLGHSSTLRRTGRVSMGFDTTLLGRIFRNTTTWQSFRMRKCLLMRCSRFMDDLVLGGFAVHSRFNVPNHW